MQSYYDRLPAAADGVVRDVVWYLSTNSAGMFLQFVSDSPTIYTNITYMYDFFGMWHFPPTGIASLDLYAWDTGTSLWRWIGISQNISMNAVNAFPALGKSTIYRMYLPTYNGITSLQIGWDQGATLVSDTHYTTPPRIIWYGTSIAEGGVASRTGMAFTNIITRRLGREILNFGFSGNGWMETDVAQYLILIPNPGAFIIDCAWNMSPTMILLNAAELIGFIREAYPDLPIVLAEGTPQGVEWITPSMQQYVNQSDINLYAAYQAMIDAGDQNIYYVRAVDLYNISGDPHHFISPTVGGLHPSDLGMEAVANFYTKFLPTIFRDNGEATRPPSFQPMEKIEDLPTTPERTIPKSHRPMPSPHAAKVASTGGMLWTSAVSLGVGGQVFNDAAPFARMPQESKSMIPAAVWESSLMSSGLFIPFITNATAISLNYTVANPDTLGGLWNMPPSATVGCDLFRWDSANSVYRFVAAIMDLPTKAGTPDVLLPMAGGLTPDPTPARYLLHLPLLNVVTDMSIGIAAGQGFVMHPDPAFSSGGMFNGNKPIVWYGSSSAQGLGATRPGTSFINILTRDMGYVVLNFGFAGLCTMDVNVASFIRNIDAAAFVVDCNYDMSPNDITENTQPFVDAVRMARPMTPIVLAAGTWTGTYWLNSTWNAQTANALNNQYQQLQQNGDPSIHFIANANDELFASDPLENPTVDGYTPSDLGHREMANYYATFLNGVLTPSVSFEQ